MYQEHNQKTGLTSITRIYQIIVKEMGSEVWDHFQKIPSQKQALDCESCLQEWVLTS